MPCHLLAISSKDHLQLSVSLNSKPRAKRFKITATNWMRLGIIPSRRRTHLPKLQMSYLLPRKILRTLKFGLSVFMARILEKMMRRHFKHDSILPYVHSGLASLNGSLSTLLYYACLRNLGLFLACM